MDDLPKDPKIAGLPQYYFRGSPMNLPRIDTEFRKHQLVWLALPCLSATSLGTASAQEEPFSTVILSDPQIWRAHNPRTEDGTLLCTDEPEKQETDGDVVCKELRSQCTSDYLLRPFKPDSLCNALIAHDAVVQTINEFEFGGDPWPDDMVCPPVGTGEIQDGCISEGADNLLIKPSAVIINGDLTEDFFETENIIYRRLYEAKLDEVWPGLGNHDYDNNVNESSPLGTGNYARGAVDWMASRLSTLPGLANYDLIGRVVVSNRSIGRKAFKVIANGKGSARQILTAFQTKGYTLGNVNVPSRQPWRNISVVFYDWNLELVRDGCTFLGRKYDCPRFVWKRIDTRSIDRALEVACFDVGPTGAANFPCILREGQVDRVGSLSYSFDKGGYRFIQLHNYLGYERDLTSDELAPKDPPFIGPPIRGGFNIKSADEWLTSELTKATALGKAVVINVHDHEAENNLKTFIENNSFNNVVAVFAGHFHPRIGQVDQWFNASGRSVPVILSGAALTGTMLYVEFYDSYFNWAAIRAWPKRDFDKSGEHEGEQHPQDRPGVECRLDPQINESGALNRIIEFATIGAIDIDDVNDWLDNNFERACYGKAFPVFIRDRNWAHYHFVENYKKQGTVTFDLTPEAGGGGTTIRPPIASCSDVLAHAGSECSAEATIDNGSYDPDGGPLILQQSPPGPYGVGEHSVTLTVLDESGATDSCEAAVTVVDIEKPELFCESPAKISPSETPISFTATGTDNCGTPTVYIKDHSCYRINGSGKAVNFSKSCKPEVFVDTMTITKSNGIGTRITWSPVAEDENGNVTTTTCNVDVVKLPDQPAKLGTAQGVWKRKAEAR
jgi:hypothetical protein